MHIDIFKLEAPGCTPDENFYRCERSDFNGCCHVNPCHLERCPRQVFPGHGLINFETSSTAATSDSDSAATSSAEMSRPVGVLKGDNSPESDSIPMTIVETKDSTVMVGTMTDSGTTRTIPNHSKVTITKKTTIVTNKSPIRTPSPSTLSSLDESIPSTLFTTTLSPSPTETVAPESGSGSGSPISTGAIVGMAIGGLAGLLILITLITTALKRRKGLERSHSMATSNGGTELNSHGEKLPQSMSAHTTGTQGSGDPFAPFGGRVDKPGDPHAPPSNTFEMDATSTVPVELPATSVGSQPRPRTEARPVQDAGSSDPRANLNASLTDRHQHMYVNHWNQYRNLGQEER